MEIAMIASGRWVGNMVKRLLGGGHEVVGWDRDQGVVDALAKEGMTGSTSLADLISKMKGPRAVWVMVPAGGPTENTIKELAGLMSENDIIIDGGNSRYTDSVRHAKELSEKKIRFLDAGTSGGIWGLTVGYCLMVGGDKSAYETCLPALTTLAPKDGLGYFGTAGAGHYVKMVHNGIEYAMMQSYAEGFELLKECEYKFDLRQVTNVWCQGPGRPLVAPRARRRRVQEGPGALPAQGPRQRLGRRPLDGRRRRSPRRLAPDDRAQPLRSIRVAQGEQLQPARARGPPQRVRRPRGDEGFVVTRRIHDRSQPATKRPRRGPHRRRVRARHLRRFRRPSPAGSSCPRSTTLGCHARCRAALPSVGRATREVERTGSICRDERGRARPRGGSRSTQRFGRTSSAGSRT